LTPFNYLVKDAAMNIKEDIRKAINRLGIKDGEFAYLCGIHPVTLSRYLNGHREPDSRALKKMWPHLHPEDAAESDKAA
jgi:predicted transcriptional regulator